MPCCGGESRRQDRGKAVWAARCLDAVVCSASKHVSKRARVGNMKVLHVCRRRWCRRGANEIEGDEEGICQKGDSGWRWLDDREAHAAGGRVCVEHVPVAARACVVHNVTNAGGELTATAPQTVLDTRFGAPPGVYALQTFRSATTAKESKSG